MNDAGCQQTREWLGRLNDGGGELPDEVQLHLTQCATCRGMATDYQAALSAYRAVTNDDLMVPRFDAVREATETQLTRYRWWWGLRRLPLWLRVALPLAALAALVAMLL